MSDQRQHAEAQRYAAYLRQKNGSVPMGPPPPQKRVSFKDHDPKMNPGIMELKPPIVKPVDRITGSSPKIPLRNDPLNTYKNNQVPIRENMSAKSDADGDMYASLKQVLTLIVIAILSVSVYVIPESYRVFWLVVLGTTLLMCMGFKVYKEWMEMSSDMTMEAENRDKYSAWGLGMLYAITAGYTSVMVGITIVLIWKIYGTVTSKTNIVSEPPPLQTMEDSSMMRRSKKSRRF